jgi:hypothetical protein
MEINTYALQSSPAPAAVVAAAGHHAALVFRRFVPVADVVPTPRRGRRPHHGPSRPRFHLGPATEADPFCPRGSLHDV